MFTANVSTTVSGTLGRSYTLPVSVQAGSRIGLEVSAAAEATTALACDLDVSQAKLLAMFSNRDVVLKTNSAGSPDNTFTLVANVPFIWYHQQGALKDTADDAVTVDFSQLHIVNAGTAEATFQLDAYFDPAV